MTDEVVTPARSDQSGGVEGPLPRIGVLRVRSRLRRTAPDTVAVVWLCIVGVAMMAPTLIHGLVFAPFDLLNVFGLGHHTARAVHNIVDSDLIQQDVPWLKLEWTQVHQGHLPLWNPYSGEGMPLGLDFITASFSLPTLISFVFPARDGLLVSVLVKLFIAGTGTYVLGRVTRLSRLAAVFSGTIFELCGAFTVWLGWSQTGVMAWAGWMFAAVFLVVKGGHRVRSVAVLAIVFALSIYGGHPESTIILTVSAGVFALVLLVRRYAYTQDRRITVRGIFDLTLGTAAGLALSGPLWLPGTQLATATARFDAGGFRSLPFYDLLNFVFQGYDGLPLAHTAYVNPGNYYEVAAFVGIVPLGLALLSLIVRWRQPVVMASGAVLAVLLAIIFLPPVLPFLNNLPHAGIDWYRGLIPASLAIAVLAGVGLDAVTRDGMHRSVQYGLGGVFLCAAVLLIGVGADSAAISHSVPASVVALRERSFFWPSVGTVVGLGGAGTLVIARRRAERRMGRGARRGRLRTRQTHLGRYVALTLVAVETGFLVTAGGPLWTAGQHFFRATPGERALQRAVGSATVGFGICPDLANFPNLGILPEANIGYGIHEIAFYDTGAAPKTYYASWSAAVGRPIAPIANGTFCPSITTVALARRYGIAYVLEPPDTAGPRGSVFRETIEGEGLYFIPRAAPATLAPKYGTRKGSEVGVGRPVVVAHPDDATWRMRVDARVTSTLYLRLTDVPGWHATIDGRSTPIRRWDSVMQQLTVPPGRHLVVVTYWPATFKLGLVLAALAALLLMTAVVLAARRTLRTG